jgi:replicative DNA helicase
LVGKLPPQALDLEQAVLGALMLEKDALSSVIDIIKPEVFYEERHQKIFEAIRILFERTSPVDILTVTAQLRQQGELEINRRRILYYRVNQPCGIGSQH